MQSIEAERSQKQNYIESIRGLAAIMVVLCHFSLVFFPSAIHGSQYQAHEKWERLFYTTPLNIFIAGNFAVCLFFVLSGYVLSIPYFGENARDNDHLLAAIIKRPFRLGGMVLFSEVLAVLLLLSGGFANRTASIQTFAVPNFSRYWPHEMVNPKKILMDLTTRMFQAGQEYNAPLWTISIELYGSLLTFGFLLLFRNSRLRVIGYFLAAVNLYYGLYIGFIIGIALADLAKNFPELLGRFRHGYIAWPLLLLGLFLGSYPNIVEPSDLEGTIYAHFFHRFLFLGGGPGMVGAALVFVAIFLSPMMQVFLSNSICTFLGRISYSVYAIHFLLLGSLSCWLFLFLHNSFSYNESCAITGLLSLLILDTFSSYAITIYIDEPTTRAANQIGKHVNNSRASLRPKES